MVDEGQHIITVTDLCVGIFYLFGFFVFYRIHFLFLIPLNEPFVVIHHL